ncbi:MAG: site-specific DNA-methyltransferase [Bacilli bacterium]|nr:site-specific DNA-methyltransferase [Bacilli bacterium]
MEIDLRYGDCLDIMYEIPNNSIDCIICDLPYGTTAINWDKIIDFDLLWEQYNRICKDNSNIILFSSGEFTYKLYASNIKQYKYKLIWKKNVPTGMSSAKYRPMKYYEEILVFQKGKGCYNPQMKDRIRRGIPTHNKDYEYEHYCGENNHLEKLQKQPKKYDPEKVQPSDILEFNVVPNRKGKLHPTEKPVELLEWLVKTYSNENNIVLDNCMGSGTTGVACRNLNRSFIGIENNKKYFDIAKERILSKNE